MSNTVDWLVQNEPDFRKSRLPSLYSDLTLQKSTNPDGYAANVTAWQNALTRAALAGQLSSDSRLVLRTSDDLLNALSNPTYGRPSGLGAVLDDSVRSGKMVELGEFSNAERSIYSRSLVPSPWSILQWSLRKVGVSSGGSFEVSGRLKAGNLVLVAALEEISKQVLASHTTKGQSVTDRVMSKESFAADLARLGGTSMSRQDLDVLLRYLSRDKQALSYNSTTIKLKSSLSPAPDPITSQDTTIANLKTLLTDLTAQVSTLESRISTLQANAMASVKAGNKRSALSALRSKRLAEKNLQQRNDTLHQLEEVFTKIEQAVDQVEVMNAMESSASVLKGLNQRVGGVERVEEVVDRLREEMGKVDEVGQVISEPLDPKLALDEEEVDEELEAMEAEQKTKMEAAAAERTRKRLEEIDREERQEKSQADLESSRTRDIDADLERSTKRLSMEEVQNGSEPEMINPLAAEEA